jgi:uncharacterized membrane protein
MSEKLLGVLLTCFSDPGAAAKARRPLDDKLHAAGDVTLDTVVLQVSKKGKASVHDPRRTIAGTLTAALTWGLFGLVASGLEGVAIWAPLGAICGGLNAYYSLHHLSKAELASIAGRLPAGSSALATFVETTDPRRLLSASAECKPSVASVAAIASDLSVRVFEGADDPVEVQHGSGSLAQALGETRLLSMILARYPDPDEAKRAAAFVAPNGKKEADAVGVELICETDKDGHRHVSDPKLGVAALARSDVVSWGAFGVLAGAISGASGGGVLEGGAVTGVGWGLFGLFAGALYGLWAGRSVSARRLKGIGPLLAPGTSALLAWAGRPVTASALEAFTTPGSQVLVLRFKNDERGALLDAVEPRVADPAGAGQPGRS